MSLYSIDMHSIKTSLFIAFSIFFLRSAWSQESNRPEQPDVPGDISFDFGLAALSNSPAYFGNDLWPSRAIGLHYAFSYKLSDRLVFTPSLGFGFERLGLRNNVNFLEDASNIYQIDTVENLTLKKNMLVYTYLEMPLEVKYYPFRTVNGEGFFIGVGGVIGYRIGSQTKIKYDINEESRVDRHKADFGMNDLRYGLQAHVGWKPFSIFYKHYFSDLFQTGPADLTSRQFTIGINFTGF